MPSQSYYNSGDEWMGTGGQKNPQQSFANRAAPGVYDATRNAHANLPPAHQKEAQNKLKALQRNAPALAAGLAAAKPGALVGLAKNLLMKVDMSKDWMFLLLISFAFLKDIVDIVAAVAGSSTSWIPYLGQATVAIGMTFTFVGEIMLLMLTVTVLILTGSSFKNRGMAKYFIGIGIAFFSEALPGIGWLPLACIEAVILYGFVLFDRAYASAPAKEESKNNEDIPSFAAAEEEGMAA